MWRYTENFCFSNIQTISLSQWNGQLKQFSPTEYSLLNCIINAFSTLVLKCGECSEQIILKDEFYVTTRQPALSKNEYCQW